MSAAARTFFPPSVIAAAASVSAKTVLRRAEAEEWPRQWQGCRVRFVPPRGLRGRCARLAPQQDARRLQRELQRAVAVFSALLTMRRNPFCGREAAVRITAQQLTPLFAFSASSLFRWLRHVELHGLNGLVEKKAGCVGRKRSS